MGGIRKFEDMKAWQKARVLTNTIYKISSKGNFSFDHPLKKSNKKSCHINNA